jgi:hypothetical protein
MDRKKKIAAIAAVTHYIKSEQEVAAFSMAPFSDSLPPEPTPAPQALNLWGISGRQQQMQMRIMMQMKSFHGSKRNF